MTNPRLPGALGRMQDAISRPFEQPKMSMPNTVAGGLGVVPAAPIDTSKGVTPPHKLTAAQAKDLMIAEMLDAARSLAESTTELASRLGRRGATNGVLEVWHGVFPATGVIQRTYEVAAGMILVDNISAANPIVCSTGVPAGDTGGQTSGIGVNKVRPLDKKTIPLADHSFSLVGTAGQEVSFQVYTGLQPFGVSLL